MKGFTVIEFILVTAIFAVLFGLTSLSLINILRRTQSTISVDSVITDLRAMQTKAMIGDTEGRVSNSSYGINFATTKYTLFHGTYTSTDSANFAIDLPSNIQVLTTFPNSQVNFDAGTGEIVGYASNSASITLKDTTNNAQKVINLNKYGIVTSVN